MAQSPIATAADYADAMMAARRAKNWLFFLLLAVAVTQLALFFVARYTHIIFDNASGPPVPQHVTMLPAISATSPATSESNIDLLPPAPPIVPPPATAVPSAGIERLSYLVAVSDFLGIVLVIVLAIVLLLIVGIMLVGRLIGVSKLVSAFIWCLILGVFYFPWQAFLSRADLKIPGVLFTWAELIDPVHGANFSTNVPIENLILLWSRFLVLPLVALMILLSIQVKSSRGLRMALGEADYESGSNQPIK